MKRLLAVLMVMILTVFISACGSNDSSSSTSKTAGDTNSLEGILTIIAHDFDDTTKELNDELKKAQKAVGGTFDGYCKNEKKIEKYYSSCDKKTDKLYARTEKYAKKYYKLAAKLLKDDDAKLKLAIEDFYKAVYEDAFGDYYDAIYKDALGKLNDDYYNGIIKAATDDTDYTSWIKTRNNFYKNWLSARSNFDKKWLDARSKLYKEYSNIKKAFIYDDNFDVDAILKETNEDK